MYSEFPSSTSRAKKKGSLAHSPLELLVALLLPPLLRDPRALLRLVPEVAEQARDAVLADLSHGRSANMVNRCESFTT